MSSSSYPCEMNSKFFANGCKVGNISSTTSDCQWTPKSRKESMKRPRADPKSRSITGKPPANQPINKSNQQIPSDSASLADPCDSSHLIARVQSSESVRASLDDLQHPHAPDDRLAVHSTSPPKLLSRTELFGNGQRISCSRVHTRIILRDGDARDPRRPDNNEVLRQERVFYQQGKKPANRAHARLRRGIVKFTTRLKRSSGGC